MFERIKVGPALVRKCALPCAAAGIVACALAARSSRATSWPFGAFEPFEAWLNLAAWMLLLVGTAWSVQIAGRRLLRGQFWVSDLLMAVAIAGIVLGLARSEYALAVETYSAFDDHESPAYYQPLRDWSYPAYSTFRYRSVPWYIWTPIVCGVACCIHAGGCLALRVGSAATGLRSRRRAEELPSLRQESVAAE